METEKLTGTELRCIDILAEEYNSRNKIIAEVYAFSIADDLIGRENQYSAQWNIQYDKAFNERIEELQKENRKRALEAVIHE